MNILPGLLGLGTEYWAAMSAQTTQNLHVKCRNKFILASRNRSLLSWKQIPFRLLLNRKVTTENNKHAPKQSDSAPGRGHHGTIVSNSVFSRDVVLQEQALGILLLQSVPLSCILSGNESIKMNRDCSSIPQGFYTCGVWQPKSSNGGLRVQAWF